MKTLLLTLLSLTSTVVTAKPLNIPLHVSYETITKNYKVIEEEKNKFGTMMVIEYEDKEHHVKKGNAVLSVIDGKVESFSMPKMDVDDFMKYSQAIEKEMGAAVANKAQILNVQETKNTPFACALNYSCGMGGYYEIYRSDNVSLMLVKNEGTEGFITLMTDKLYKFALINK
ncbi:hypothetical protein WCT87_12215 [Pectobacterium brasiliense]|uniref:hypothetical protein n=1 Tax=Pectobacterium brasiliense TaxID=180957 RepID=UPI0030170ECB